MLTHLHRNAEASSFGPGLFLLFVLVLWSGVHPEFSNSPTFSFYEVRGHRWSFSGFANITAFWHFSFQYATRKDVFLHWRLHGFDPGRIRTQDQTWAPPQGCPDGKPLLLVPQKPHKYTIPDTPFLVECVFFILGNLGIDPSVCPHRSVMEYNNTVYRPALVFIWWVFFFYYISKQNFDA